MDDLLLGLELTVVGMGTVFLLLAALMVLLMGLARIDRPAARAPLRATGPVSGTPTSDTGDLADAAADTQAALTPGDGGPPESGPVVRVHAHGLDDDLLAAITIAVTTHAELRRRQAAPETRAVPPGQLRHSRWLALGRTTPPTTRS